MLHAHKVYCNACNSYYTHALLEELERRGYYSDLKDLIETMYRDNGNDEVTIVAHSMGGPIILHFLTSGIVTQAWKDTYIGNFITLSGAWSGGNEAIEAQISGLSVINERSDDLFKLFRFIGDWVRKSFKSVIHSFQSTIWLLPRPSVWGSTILVTTPTQNYTANDYQQLFSDIDYSDGYNMFQGIEGINEGWPVPNVTTHCFYGVGVDTPLSFHYEEPFPAGASNDPEVIMGDGDGVVNTPSSEVCLQWADNSHAFNHIAFNGVDHMQIVKSEVVLRNIGNIVGALRDPTPTPPPEEKKSWWEILFG